ncbi:hypothetical protein Nepgr_018470 [Nepenthes gracilis]|uniref:Protein kinase domain-containing protein n=1 Tax=Nepenthes gracilis TaxID=150966 RepID=A0AAD3STH3_NEPGR|nr:hypothetical protein Nepgr_018470 [Nepenthes gracilis]
MVASAAAAPATILIGIPLNDAEDAEALLSWAVSILARPSDTVAAIHILVGEEPKKLDLKTREQNRFRQAKAFVILMAGNFAKACLSKQVVGKGLISEAKRISASFLLLGGSKSQPRMSTSSEAAKYCFKHAPKGCSVISIGESAWWPKPHLNEDFSEFEIVSSALKRSGSAADREKDSPRTVLHGTDYDSLSFGGSSSSASPPPAHKPKMSPLKRVSSIFRLALAFDLNARRRDEARSQKERRPSLRCFSYHEISQATNAFHPDNLVGKGGYSEVYRGDLADGSTVAVKRLAKGNASPKKEKEFLEELGIIGQVSHPNTVTLTGYCIYSGLYLIFTFSPNGDLENALHSDKGKLLEWTERYNIAIGVAKGLHYLHKCCKHRIIHRDIKASNVLLGPNFEPQITDFGLAKWIPSKTTHHAVVPVEGTFGYLAPEYFMDGIVDEKTDIFSFGVLLLEILTGRRPVDNSRQNLLLWAMPHLESGEMSELVDPKLRGIYDVDQMHTLLLTASYCVRQSPSWRPSMTEVLELLTSGPNSEVHRSWRLPDISYDQAEDYSMASGYEAPKSNDLEDNLW